jgi:hypothetical protein
VGRKGANGKRREEEKKREKGRLQGRGGLRRDIYGEGRGKVGGGRVIFWEGKERTSGVRGKEKKKRER